MVFQLGGVVHTTSAAFAGEAAFVADGAGGVGGAVPLGSDSGLVQATKKSRVARVSFESDIGGAG